MRTTKNILLTFDFELFLGERSGSVDNCLIKPTLELKKIIDRYELSTVFFVDTLYLHRLKEIATTNERAASDYSRIVSLLQSLVDSKAFIFHHIHPHWLDAKYLEELNEWDVSDKSRFALNNLTTEEVEKVFEHSEQIISEIYQNRTRPVLSGFRAGGLYAQPFSHFKSEMLKHGISIDFSVLKGAKSEGLNGLYGFDYSVFPTDTIFRFSDDLVKKDDEGAFIEIMMDQFKLEGVNKIINGIYYRKNVKKDSWKRWGDGKASGNVLKSSIKANRFSNEETYSIELLNKFKALLYAKHLKDENFLHMISHPKLFSQANIDSFELFIKKAMKRYKVETNVFGILENNNLVINE